MKSNLIQSLGNTLCAAWQKFRQSPFLGGRARCSGSDPSSDAAGIGGKGWEKKVPPLAPVAEAPLWRTEPFRWQVSTTPFSPHRFLSEEQREKRAPFATGAKSAVRARNLVVMLLGFCFSSANFLASALPSDQIEATGSMVVARRGHTATALP